MWWLVLLIGLADVCLITASCLNGWSAGRSWCEPWDWRVDLLCWAGAVLIAAAIGVALDDHWAEMHAQGWRFDPEACAWVLLCFVAFAGIWAASCWIGMLFWDWRQERWFDGPMDD